MSIDRTDKEGARAMRTPARVGIREVAERAGVAVSSVSRVLSNHPDVSGPMRERVHRAVEELQYEPDLVAQGLRRRHTQLIGFVVSDISNSLLATVAMGAETSLREQGYSVLLINSESRPELDARHLRILLRRRVDGLLLSLASETDAETLRILQRTEVPVVIIDRDIPAEIGASAVLSDHRSGMRAAAARLLELGHRRIGLITGLGLRFSRERARGLRDAYDELGLPHTFSVRDNVLGREDCRAAAAALLDGSSAVTAIIVGGNQLLHGVLEAIQARDLRIGRDISLVSSDATSLTELFDPPIAVVTRDTHELGQRAAELLLARLEEKPAPASLILPTRFVERASVGPAPSV